MLVFYLEFSRGGNIMRHTYTQTDIHTYIHIDTHTYTYLHTHTHTPPHTHINTLTYTHMHTHSCTHTDVMTTCIRFDHNSHVVSSLVQSLF